MGDGNEGRIKLLGFMYIHVILVWCFRYFRSYSVSVWGGRVRVCSGCIIPPNYYYIEPPSGL